jgi:phage gpG-like protein
MAKTRIEIDVDDSDAQRKLSAMGARSQNMRPVFEQAKFMLRRANAANFASNGLPVGGWAPRRDEELWPLMKRTGALAGSLSTLSGPPNDIGRRDATFGTSVEYAKFHQYGTSRMPKRQVVFEPLGFRQELSERAVSYIINMRKRVF